MYCRNCGNKMEEQDWFCRKCGKKNEESDKDRITNETFKTTANMNVSTTSGRTSSTYVKVCSVFSCVLLVILAFKYVDIAQECQQDSFYAFALIAYDNIELAKLIYWIFSIYILVECIMSIVLIVKNKNGHTLVTRGSSCFGAMLSLKIGFVVYYRMDWFDVWSCSEFSYVLYRCFGVYENGVTIGFVVAILIIIMGFFCVVRESHN